MTSTAEHGAVPTLDADALAAMVGPVADEVDLRAASLHRVPGAALRIDDIYELADAIEAALGSGSDGVVVTQGTDTLEETAFLLDLLLDRRAPVVLTGAMRHPTAAGADGPANLATAVAAAASGIDFGTVVLVMNDELHAATRVQKSHSTLASAFTSDGGPLGLVSEGRVILRSVPAARTPTVPRGSAPASVPIVTIGAGDDGRGLRAADGADGVVIAALGAGHLPEWLVEEVAEISVRIPTILTSRTRRGPVLRSTYGFVGSEVDLRGRGLATVGTLDPFKARILLIALLRAGFSHREISVWLHEMDSLL